MDDLFCGLTGRVVLPCSPAYNELRQGYNRAIQQFPVIIVYCADVNDVANAVCWAREQGVPIRIRSGGHNYEGYSNGNCTLVIDISEMHAIHINEVNALLHVQAGVTNRQVYEAVSSLGYPFPGGTCPTVGVSGYALGGGWGLSCRYLGLGCDSLQEVEMVNFGGEIITANDHCNSDLFWALRGAGGGNFGVVTSMTFRLPQKVKQVTLIEIDYLNVLTQEQADFLQIWQHWLKNADDRMTLQGRIYNAPDDGLSMLLRGIFYGEPWEAKRMLHCFLTLPNAVYNLESVSFLTAVTILGSSYPPFEKFQSASRFALHPLSCCDAEALAAIVRHPPQGSVFVGISLYALGGQVAAVPQDDTAFYYRDAGYILWLNTVWEENRFARENENWIARWFPCLASMTAGSYVNFPYNGLPDFLEEYYCSHAECLKAIKAKYDPCNVFSFPQGLDEAEGHLSGRQIASDSYEQERQPIVKQDTLHYRGFRYVSK